MKTKAKQELRAKTDKELSTLLLEMKNELFAMQLEKSQKKLKNLSAIMRRRKDIARVMTLINEQQLVLEEKGATV